MAELHMLLSGSHAFHLSCPVKFWREAYFVCQHLLCKFFQRNISEGCSKDKKTAFTVVSKRVTKRVVGKCDLEVVAEFVSGH